MSSPFHEILCHCGFSANAISDTGLPAVARVLSDLQITDEGLQCIDLR